MTEKKTTKTKTEKPERGKPVIEVRSLGKKPDMFHVYNKQDGLSYRHVEKNPLRVREMELEGWWICDGPEIVGSPIALESSPNKERMDLPEMILMCTTQENKDRMDDEKGARLRQHERDVKDKVDQVGALLNRSGLGHARGRLGDDKMQF